MKINLEIEFIINENVKITKKHINLLKQIQIDKSISQAAKNLKMSYKNAWDSLDEINKASDEPLFLSTSRKEGTKLSKYSENILQKYDEFCEFKKKINSDFSHKISAQNKIKAKIIQISQENNCVKIVCDKNNNLINVNISKNALKELDLKLFDDIYLLLKINFIELEEDGENSYQAKIIDIKNQDDFIYFDLDFDNTTLKAVTKKSKLQKTYKTNDFITFKIPSQKIIISL